MQRAVSSLVGAQPLKQMLDRLLGWEPKQPGLIADIDQPSYFES
jgi:hypothetical protein